MRTPTPPLLVELSEAELRGKTSLKWSRVGPAVLAADIAEMDFRVAAPVLRALAECIERSDLGYPDFIHGTPARLAEVFRTRTERQFGWSPDVRRTELCAQVMQALGCAVLAYTGPGDGVLTHAPTYPPIVDVIQRLGRVCVRVPVGGLSSLRRLSGSIASAGAGAGAPVRMVVLCQPHNPTGHVFDRRTLEVIAQFARRHDVIVFSDEIYQDLVYDAAGFCSAGSIDGLRERAIVFTSAAKSFNIAGLRCAVGHFGSAAIHEAFCRLPWHLRDGASLLGVDATIAAWSSCDGWLDKLRTQLAENRSAAVRRINASTEIRCSAPAATYFTWVDARGSRAARDPRGFFLREAGVALQSGRDFGTEFAGFVRLNFATSTSILGTILDRISGALENSAPRRAAVW